MLNLAKFEFVAFVIIALSSCKFCGGICCVTEDNISFSSRDWNLGPKSWDRTSVTSTRDVIQ